MFLAIALSLTLMGCATWLVLNQRTLGSRRSTTRISAVLLGASGVMLTAGLLGGLLGWF